MTKFPNPNQIPSPNDQIPKSVELREKMTDDMFAWAWVLVIGILLGFGNLVIGISESSLVARR